MKKYLFSGLSLLSLAAPLLIGCNQGGKTASSSEGGSSTPASSSEQSSALPLDDNKVHIIVLAGQSGARGKGLKEELTSEQSMTNEDVYIYQDGHPMAYIETPMAEEPEGNLDTFLKPGFGDSSGEIGPEVGIGETFRSRYHDQDNYKAVIVKYTVCGTDFPNHWYSTSMVNDAVIGPTLNKDANHIRTYKEKQMGPLTKDLYKLLDNCIADLKAEGLDAQIDGLAWVHGEMDAQNASYIANYKKSLKYFINDFRTAFGANVPVVVSEVLTNAAGYRKDLKEAQEDVSEELDNVTLIENDYLYSNSFEPWHYSAQSNMYLGNEIAAALLKKQDNRVISSLALPEQYGDAINVPQGYDVDLPAYLPFEYDSGLVGMSEVFYTEDYDNTTLGLKDVPFTVSNANGVIYNGKLPVNVVAAPYVDGEVEEEELYTELVQTVDENLDIYYATDSKGLYLAGSVTDNHVWSDAEQWKTGDMGQMTRNDDVRFFITGSTVNQRRTVCISAANMFRFYKAGRSINENTGSLQVDNLFYKGQLSNKTAYRTTFDGYANDNSKTSTGWRFELYVTFADLGVTSASGLKILPYHSDIQNPNGISGKVAEPRTGGTGSEKYIVNASVSEEYKEENISAYFTLA